MGISLTNLTSMSKFIFKCSCEDAKISNFDFKQKKSALREFVLPVVVTSYCTLLSFICILRSRNPQVSLCCFLASIRRRRFSRSPSMNTYD